jgi:peroxiredoxin
MRKLRPVSLLLIGIVACTTQHSGERSASGAMQQVAPPAPPLLGTLPDGKDFNLRELRGERVLLVFYRSASCGLCIQQLRHLAAAAEAYDHLDTRILAITADPPELNQRTAKLLDLDFPIVSVDHATLTRWGLWPEGERTPHPGAFIIDEKGGLLFEQIGRTAADRTSDATLVFTLRSIDRTGTARGAR